MGTGWLRIFRICPSVRCWHFGDTPLFLRYRLLLGKSGATRWALGRQ
jgi:hypothetical protein